MNIAAFHASRKGVPEMTVVGVATPETVDTYHGKRIGTQLLTDDYEPGHTRLMNIIDGLYWPTLGCDIEELQEGSGHLVVTVGGRELSLWELIGARVEIEDRVHVANIDHVCVSYADGEVHHVDFLPASGADYVRIYAEGYVSTRGRTDLKMEMITFAQS